MSNLTRPLRSVLYIPGSKPRALDKARDRRKDAVTAYLAAVTSGASSSASSSSGAPASSSSSSSSVSSAKEEKQKLGQENSNLEEKKNEAVHK